MSRVFSGGIRLLAVTVALILAIGVLQPKLAAAAPAIIVNPTSGPAGTNPVTVTGSGFGSVETVTITFHDGTNFGPVATVNTNAAGNFSTTFTVPGGAAPGPYIVTATGGTTGRTANAPFQVTTTPATTLSLTKYVSTPGNGVLTYQLSYQNTGGATATGVVVTDTLQAGQTLQPSSLSAGCSYTTSSGGVVTVSCVPNPTGTPGTLPAGSAGSFFFNTTVNCGSGGTINNTATISSTNAGSQNSNTTSVTVGPSTCTPGSISLQKSVEDNNSGVFSTSVNANPGDVVTYDIAFINSSTSTYAPAVTITDTLQPGQNWLAAPYSSGNCSAVSSNTISCPLGDVPPNTRVDTFISASINANTPGTAIPNQAQATTGGTTINSNTTTVYVYGPSGCTATSCCASTLGNNCCLNGTPNSCCANGVGNNCCFNGTYNTCCFNGTYNTCCVNGTFNGCCVNGTFNNCALTGNFVLCGLVSASTPGTITVNGVSVAVLPNAAVSGPVTPGSNVCITFALNGAGQATALAVSSNLAGVGVACGTYGGATTTGAIVVTGIRIPVAPTAQFQGFLAPGGFYCFLLTSSGQAYAVLSGIPTALEAAGGSQVGPERYL